MSSGNSGKVAFSLGGKKKKAPSSQDAKATAAAFGADRKSAARDENQSSSHPDKPEAPLIIPLSQPTQSLLTRVKHEESDNNGIKQEEHTAADTAPSSTPAVKAEPDGPVISSGGNTNLARSSEATTASLPGDSSKDQLQRDLDALPEETNEESYDHVPVSQFGAALLRGMGWSEKKDSTASQSGEQGMPRPHRLGLGAIPKAPNPDEHMPSVLTGRRKRGGKLSVQQLQQQEDFEKKQKLLLQQDKQRTRQIGSIVHLNSGQNQRAKLVQLQGVPGLNMVQVQLEGEAQPTAIKKGEVGPLVGRPELEDRPFVVPKERRNGRDRGEERDRRRSRSPSRERKSDRDRDRRRDRSRSGERDRDGKRSRDRDECERSRRDRSRSRNRDRDSDNRRKDRRRDRSRSEDRDSDERRSDRKRDRRDRDKDKERSKDRRERERKREDRKSKDRRDRDRDRNGKRRHRDSDDESDRGNEKASRKRSKSDRQEDSNPLWIIPNIRVRVVTEKLGKKYFRQKGVIVDVTRRHGATLRMDMTEGNGNSVVLEHVPERYLETGLPKAGGNAIVLTGSNKWTKGRLLERNSKTSEGSIQVFEDLNVLTLSLDDLAEWCGPLDDALG